ncbi:MAG TPA: dimethylsulfonioproprionate lyase family protein [Aestuariivirga sp.]|nr:dimethylsulfonioproprionate lyase family protein [Aestuariivirga sp.]
MGDDLYNDARWLVGAIARGLQARGGSHVDVVLQRLAAQDMTREDFVEPRAQTLPVTRYFAGTIAETMIIEPELAAAIASLDGHLKWLQSKSYTDEVLGAGFGENYGWCEIIGPQGFFKGDDFLLGLLMLGPQRHYKDHYHPAPELYWPLTGPTEWKQGSGVFETKPAGAGIYHAPMVHHATRTAEHPLLTVWSWTKDTHTPAKLVDA